MPDYRGIFKLLVLCEVLLFTPSTLCALSLTKTQDLVFGRVVGGSGYSGNVTVGTSGERYASGGLRLLGSVFSPARFVFYGSPGETYSITIPAALTIVSGGDSMDVSAVTCSVPLKGSLPPSGVLAFTVGGTMTVKATQRSKSTYSGDFNVSVAGN